MQGDGGAAWEPRNMNEGSILREPRSRANRHDD
ncbi:hypothetical protein SMJ63A_140031 [Stenotrophomonas geniculata]|nr:protein of unknown function [Stenotrophomonas maltophilia]